MDYPWNVYIFFRINQKPPSRYFLWRNIIQCRHSEYCYQGVIQLLLEYQIHLQDAGRNLFCFWYYMYNVYWYYTRKLLLELLSKLGGELDRSVSGPGFSLTLLIIKMKWRTNKRKTTFTFGFKLWSTRRDTNNKGHRKFVNKIFLWESACTNTHLHEPLSTQDYLTIRYLIIFTRASIS